MMSQSRLEIESPSQKIDEVVVLSPNLGNLAVWEEDDLFHEIIGLTNTAGGRIVYTARPRTKAINSALFVGKGTARHIADVCQQLNATLLVVNAELTPVQQKNLEALTKTRVVDRTGLILDIFAQRAKTREGKLQIELAQLTYLLPRLTKMWTHLSRLGGGIGTRGPGETQLETDKRRIQEKIHRIKKSLKRVTSTRTEHRKRRRKKEIPLIGLVGYTNSGKSTLFSLLTGQKTHIQNTLFATLDPLIRRFEVMNNVQALLLDTVGFINALPTQLIASFKSTLEEIIQADLLLHIIDASHPARELHIQTVIDILREIGAGNIPVIQVWNKADLLSQGEKRYSAETVQIGGNTTLISALNNWGIENLKEGIAQNLKGKLEHLQVSVPYSNKKAFNFIHHSHVAVLNAEYRSDSVLFSLEINAIDAARLRNLLHSPPETIVSPEKRTA